MSKSKTPELLYAPTGIRDGLIVMAITVNETLRLTCSEY